MIALSEILFFKGTADQGFSVHGVPDLHVSEESGPSPCKVWVPEHPQQDQRCQHHQYCGLVEAVERVEAIRRHKFFPQTVLKVVGPNFIESGSKAPVKILSMNP